MTDMIRRRAGGEDSGRWGSPIEIHITPLVVLEKIEIHIGGIERHPASGPQSADDPAEDFER